MCSNLNKYRTNQFKFIKLNIDKLNIHKHKDKCQTPNLTEEDIKLKFIKAFNFVMEDKERIIQDSNEVIELLTDTIKVDYEISNINDELIITAELMN